MPLSEHEQKILEEIERRLYEEDPSFARDVRRRRFGVPARARLGMLLFAGGLLALIGFFVTRSLLLGVAAFGGMVAGIVLFVGAIRSFAIARAAADGGLRGRLTGALAQLEERLRRRHRRD